jgi:two-component system phosphate regulon sensor histidine kinase PhoR
MAAAAGDDRYAETFEDAPIARLITDRFGVVREANRAAAILLDATQPWLVGKPLTMFVPPEDRPAFTDGVSAAGSSTTPVTWLGWLRPRSGVTLRAAMYVSASQRHEGELHWAFTDVTERMAMEQELRTLASELETRVEERTREVEAERARLAAVVDQIPAGLIITTAEGRVATVNAEATRLLGEDVTDGLEAISSAAHGRAEMARSDGTHVVLETSAAPIVDLEGRSAGAIHLFRDVSLRERQERAEREFVTNAAHQLQSPLAAILSAIEVLQSGAKDGPERDNFLRHIEREAHRLARLVRALLVLARAQTGYEAPKDELIAIRPLLESVAASIRPAEGVRVEVEGDASLAVVTNRELIEQAVLNVAENAAKYTHAGQIFLDARAADGGAEIVVSDTGPGIAEADHARVMERFYRAADNGDGFGLGFAIVRSAMEALGGELALDSSLGTGTTVRLRLPQAATLVAT